MTTFLTAGSIHFVRTPSSSTDLCILKRGHPNIIQLMLSTCQKCNQFSCREGEPGEEPATRLREMQWKRQGHKGLHHLLLHTHGLPSFFWSIQQSIPEWFLLTTWKMGLFYHIPTLFFLFTSGLHQACVWDFKAVFQAALTVASLILPLQLCTTHNDFLIWFYFF